MKATKKVTKDLTEGNLWRNYFFYILPLIASSLLSSLYSTVDAMIAGKFISEYALGAISATGSYDTVFYSFFNGFGGGFSIYVAHLLHSYMRGLGSVNVVLGISLCYSIANLTATLLLVPMLGMEGVFLGRLLGWVVDALLSLTVYLLFFRSEDQICRVAEKTRAKKQKAAEEAGA